jgi:hypothetical protein
MECIEGRSLGESIPKEGMPLDRLLNIAIPLADAVSAAHQAGITHTGSGARRQGLRP